MSIKNLVEMIKRNGLLASMEQLEKLYQVAIENEQKLAESEARSAALAAENAGLKESRKNLVEFIHEELNAGYPLNMSIETPNTDAFLAEVRAQGVEMFAASLKVVGGGEHPYSAVANEFADQLRKGVQS
ncbi:hypothetical protein [Enterobacter roggenkampii]|uniref:hypothetical protein n=1 Tax=Enterobacter roggenkampii TaxID=1812935 RepID=UPI0021753FE0|nr:hypothetical protein [Enterobacter roggenkampii]